MLQQLRCNFAYIEGVTQAKANCAWELEYLHESVADTDVPDTIVGLVKQRRRWLNGAFFTLLFSIANFPRLLRQTSHSWLRKLLLFSQLLYMLLNLLVNWFVYRQLPRHACRGVVTWTWLFQVYRGQHVLVGAHCDEHHVSGRGALFSAAVLSYRSHQRLVFHQAVFGIMTAYFSLWLVQFVLALGTKATDFGGIYNVISFLHAVVMWGTFVALIYFLAKNASLGWLFIVGFFGIACYLLAAVMYVVKLHGCWQFACSRPFRRTGCIGCRYGESCFIATSAVQYIAMVPTFMSVIGVFAFCNVHDVSWGTREGMQRGHACGAVSVLTTLWMSQQTSSQHPQRHRNKLQS